MITLIMPGEPSPQLRAMAEAAIDHRPYQLVRQERDLGNLRHQRLLFVMDLDETGVCVPMLELLRRLRQISPQRLLGATGALLINSSSPHFTKSAASHLIFNANQLGCAFIGHPLVDATEELKNLLTWQKTQPLPLEEILLNLSGEMGNRLYFHDLAPCPNPKLVFLHSSLRSTSNTLTLWQRVADHLSGWDIQELHVENGAVYDCYGCSFKTCVQFGKQKSCFYGGVMTEKILPSVEEADVLVWVCPNYNDALPSNLMAVINRLTTLYRQIRFYDKRIFSVIVSGNSGGDSVARQLIGALNINKGFYLPPEFALMAIGNDPGSVIKNPDIDEQAEALANRIIASVK